MVGLHRGKVGAPWQKLGWWMASAGRRRLEATMHPPINTRRVHDLLPAASLGAANASSH
jgi:hypothetical protein